MKARYPFILLLISLMFTAAVHAEKAWLQPYILASDAAGQLQDVMASVKSKLTNAGFDVVGEYSPYPGAAVVIVTNDTLRQHAAESQFGGYGAAVRVSVTQVGDKVEVAYVNPEWMSGMYRMKNDLKDIAGQLKSAIGAESAFGTENLWNRNNLTEYHYTVFMPYFDDHNELASYASQDEALKAVEAGLAAGKGGTSKVYRVDIPGKQESVFGVAIQQGDGADKTVMQNCDIGKHKHTAHLPYDLLVSNGRVYALHGKFRIAQSFPDLTMTTFMKISGAPDAIEDALAKAAGAE
jgi:uncharacterized protein (DUF302 family)